LFRIAVPINECVSKRKREASIRKYVRYASIVCSASLRKPDFLKKIASECHPSSRLNVIIPINERPSKRKKENTPFRPSYQLCAITQSDECSPKRRKENIYLPSSRLCAIIPTNEHSPKRKKRIYIARHLVYLP
jgi:hypothetical protein